MRKTKIKGIAKFFARIEGRDIKEVSVALPTTLIDFPREVSNLEYFRTICDIPLIYNPGEEVTEGVLRDFVDKAFLWHTGPYEDLFEELHEEGYLHQEVYDCLESWRQQLEAGMVPRGYEVEEGLEDFPDVYL